MPTGSSLRFAVALSLLTSLVAAPVEAQAARDAALVLRVLSYDRNLATRAPSQREILVVYAPGSDAERQCRDLATAISALGRRVTVAERHVRARMHPYSTPEALGAAMTGSLAIFVCDGLSGSVGAIARESRSRSVLTLTSAEAQVRGGLAVGIVQRRAQTRLVVNLRASRAEGARLDAALLRLADVRR